MIFGYRALLTLSATCVLASIAVAGGPLSRPMKQEARDHLDRGNRLYNTRSFDDAILEFKAGALVEPAPVFDYNLGQAYRQTGKYQEALWHYDRFLTYGHPTGELLDAVNAFVAEMKAHLADRAHSMPPTEPAADTDSVQNISAAPPMAPPASHPIQLQQSVPVDEPSRVWTWLGWGLTAASIVGGGVSTGLVVNAAGLDSDAKDTTRTISDRINLQNQADSRRRAALVVGVGSGAALVLGVFVLAIPARQSRLYSTNTVSLGLTGNGAAVFGRF